MIENIPLSNTEARHDRGIGGHTRPNRGRSDDWLTPPEIIEALGPFDLDPCASENQPWPTASTQWTITDNGLLRPWGGLVWLNPPYGPETWEWLDRLARHGNGIALIFARTETEGFWNHAWLMADWMFFLKGRLFFRLPVTGARAPSNSGGPSILLGYGPEARKRFLESGLSGALVESWGVQ